MTNMSKGIMRDLGSMGESTFSLWCAETGLIPNGSIIDKTGWDFFVEFPFLSGVAPTKIHESAFECKVQVKATDNTKRKLSIKLSNLRRLITAQMPAFFIFIEFDGKNTAQRAFVVHIDNQLISKVLKRLHEIEQSNKRNNFNKRTMTISYDTTHMMPSLDGSCLKDVLLGHMGNNMAEYIIKKKSHLESTGFENGFAQIQFRTEGEDNLKKLIDVSIGIEKQVNVSYLKGTNTRFSISSKNPFMDYEGGKLEMPDLKPNAEGTVKFKEDKLTMGLSFSSKLYCSPLNAMLPDKLKKLRVEGEFFDLSFNPYTGAATYSFSVGEGIRLEVRKFRNALKLMSLLGSSGKQIDAILDFDGFPKLEFKVGCNEQDFNCLKELKALECAVKLISDFDVTDYIDISFKEISIYETEICQTEHIVSTSSSPNLYKVEFSVNNEGFDSEKEVACIFLTTAPIGSHIFGILVVLMGIVVKIENERFRLITNSVVIEKRIVSEKDDPLSNEDLVTAVEEIEKKYDKNYSVITMFELN